MKKILVILLLVLFSFSFGRTVVTSGLPSSISFTGGVTANNYNNSIYVSSNGNVGIGTTAPSTKLEVAGSMIVDAYNNGGEGKGISLRTGTTAASNVGISVKGLSSPETPDGLNLAGNDGISFTTAGSGAGAGINQMVILGDVSNFPNCSIGNVGVGVPSPSVKLEVAGKVSANYYIGVGSATTPSAVEGAIFYHTVRKKLIVYDGTSWKDCF